MDTATPPFTEGAVNLRTWLRGTYRWVSEMQLQVYLDEMCSASTAGARRWQPSKRSSASVPSCRPRHREVKDPTLGLAELTG